MKKNRLLRKKSKCQGSAWRFVGRREFMPSELLFMMYEPGHNHRPQKNESMGIDTTIIWILLHIIIGQHKIRNVSMALLIPTQMVVKKIANRFCAWTKLVIKTIPNKRMSSKRNRNTATVAKMGHEYVSLSIHFVKAQRTKLTVNWIKPHYLKNTQR